MNIGTEVRRLYRSGPVSSRITIRASRAEIAAFSAEMGARITYEHDPGMIIGYLGVRIQHDPDLDPPAVQFTDPGMA